MTEQDDAQYIINQIAKIPNSLYDTILSYPHFGNFSRELKQIEALQGKNYKLELEENLIRKLIDQAKPELLKIIHEENNFAENEKELTECLNRAAINAKILNDNVLQSESKKAPLDRNFADTKCDEIGRDLNKVSKLLQQEVSLVGARAKLAENLRKIIVQLQKDEGLAKS